MAKAVVTATTLVTDDGVPIDTIHLPGQKDLAIQNYEKALQLNPGRANAIAMLKKLREQ